MSARELSAEFWRAEEERRRLEKEHQERAREAANEAIRERQRRGYEAHASIQKAWREKHNELTATRDAMRNALHEAQGRMANAQTRGDFEAAKAAANEIPGLEVLLADAQRSLDHHISQPPSGYVPLR